MSTKVNVQQPYNSATARERRKEVRRIKRNIRMVLFFTLVCIIAVLAVLAIFQHKNVQALNDRIEILNGQVTQLTEENQSLSTGLREHRQLLGMFVDTNEVQVTAPTTYHIPLEDDMQAYVYNLCVDYYIPEHYELILAMMWHESDFTANVISSTNDYGIMQINAINHAWLCEALGVDDFLDPNQNIHAGIYMISKLIHKYGDVHKALMAYNLGEKGAKQYWAAGIYSTSYSNGILAKQAAIKADSYK